MNTKRGLVLTLVGLMTFSLLLSACSTPPADNVAENTGQTETEEAAVEPTDEPAAEPSVTPTEDLASAEAILDENVSAFLGGMEGFNTTSPAEVNSAMGEGSAPFLIDVRTPAEIEENGYIEGAVNIPLKELAKNTDKLPSTDTPIVVYCGVGTRAAIGTMLLGELGYTHVKAMQGGSFGGWVAADLPVATGMPAEAPVLNEANLDPAAVAAVDAALESFPNDWAQLAAPVLKAELDVGTDLVLLDVRTPEELEANSQIEGAVNIPLDKLIAQKDEWPSQEANIVVYCGVGYRGNLAMTILRSYGYESVRNLSGGFNGWVAAGLPFEGSEEASEAPVVDEEALAAFEENVLTFINSGESYHSTTPAEVNDEMAAGNAPFLVDLRTEDKIVESNGIYIPGATDIPLELLAYNLVSLPSKDSAIVVYGSSDAEAAIGAVALAAVGYTDVRSMQGGSLKGWIEADYPTMILTASGPG